MNKNLCLVGVCKDTEGLAVLLGEQWTGDDSSGKSAYCILPTEIMSSNEQVCFAFCQRTNSRCEKGTAR